MPSCPSCAGPIAPGDRFCGECGAPAIIVAANPRGHVELSLSAHFAAVTDRGRRHVRNEDAVLIAERHLPKGVYRLLAISDGVSNSWRPQRASAAAVEAFRDAAFAALDAGLAPPEAMGLACDAAQQAVCAIASPEGCGSAAATLVAALAFEEQAYLAWAGDSRAYLLARESRLLTRDDSWLNAIVDCGEMSEKAARASAYAHAITSCLGPVAPGKTFSPNFALAPLPHESALLLCSDGLWNYAETPQSLAALAPAGDALAACRSLAAFANDAGGRDNISVAILRNAADA